MASFINFARICVTTTKATLSRHRVPALGAMYHSSKQLGNNRDIVHPSQDEDVPIPKPKVRTGESLVEKKARLLYQSRKRGMLENGLLLSTFAYKYLDILTEPQLQMYDEIINLPSNDWDIYYWIIGKQTAPEEYQNEVMTMMQEFAQNRNLESRIAQPDLKPLEM